MLLRRKARNNPADIDNDPPPHLRVNMGVKMCAGSTPPGGVFTGCPLSGAQKVDRISLRRLPGYATPLHIKRTLFTRSYPPPSLSRGSRMLHMHARTHARLHRECLETWGGGAFRFVIQGRPSKICVGTGMCTYILRSMCTNKHYVEKTFVR